MSTSENKIGFFDSGLGGLSVWDECRKELPHENTLYLSDSLNAPYGSKPKETILELSIANTEKLLEQGCKAIVVACNTATTNAIDYLREHYHVPFIGIEPATKPAALNTKTGVIGILATKGTLASELFLQTSAQFRGNTQLIETIGHGLVPIVESGHLEDARPLLQQYLQPMVEAGIDNLVLGCTHYPFLKPIIKELIPDSITIVDSGKPVALRVKKVLSEEDLLAPQTNQAVHEFHTNGNPAILKQFLERLNAEAFTVNGV